MLIVAIVLLARSQRHDPLGVYVPVYAHDHLDDINVIVWITSFIA